MTFQPVLPPILLALLAAAVLVLRVVTLRRMTATDRTGIAVWRWCGMTLATLLLLGAAARPVIEPDEHGASRVADREAPNVFMVVDRSPEMRVQDDPGGESRMAAARDDVATLIDRYPGARVAVISFATRPVLEWPLSADTRSLRPVTDAFEPYAATPDDVSQTNAGAAGNMLRYQLISATQQYPRAKTLVFYLGAGAPGSEQPPRDFNLPEGAVDGGAVLGYDAGSAVGQQALRGIADQIGVPYVARADAESVVSATPTDPTVATAATTAPVAASGETELYWAPAALAAMLILAELCMVLHEFRRTRLVARAVNA
ncbi:MAG: VWA domain-containing protein [Mycobacterium sp.]